MVWIYGGAYMFGASGEPGYDGTPFAQAGAVFVSFNYRLGMEGFALLPGAPANRGLLDAVAALTWVRDNIEGFGGDPGNVTVFGESAGAGVIASLLAMDKAKGLFKRAIAQSVPGTFFARELAEDIARGDRARSRPAERARGAGRGRSDAPGQRAERRRGEAEGLPAVGRGQPHHHPVLARSSTARCCPARRGGRCSAAPPATSSCSPATTGTSTGCSSRSTAGSARSPTRRRRRRCATFAPAPDGPAAYRKAFPDADPSALYELVFSDWLFRMPTLHLAQAHAVSGGRTFLYELAAQAPGGPFGACHALDVPLVFGASARDWARRCSAPACPPSSSTLGDTMRREWLSFAAVGDPGWPAYGTEHRTTRVYDLQPDVLSYPEETSMHLWERHQFDALHLAR